MEELKLLFVTKDRSLQLDKSTAYLMAELRNQASVELWDKDGPIGRCLEFLSFKPDFILLNDYFNGFTPHISGLSHVTIPKGMIFHDLHHKRFLRERFVEREQIDVVFTHYRDAFLQWFPHMKNRMHWLPHSVEPNLFRDYDLPKTIDYLMMGATFSFLYPVRSQMLQTMKREPGFVYHPHPGYKEVSESQRDMFIGKKYAMEINRSKIFLTCDSIYHYPVMKYFEVLACNTLLLAPHSNELKDLGFIDGENFVAVDESNFLQKARFYLHNEPLRLEIASRGHSFIHSRHTIKHRAKEMISRMKEEIAKKANL
ncbi:glycosyltransferase [Fictibacillus sp. Mic-4]|uniref:glycosyltransferase family protein n=1 Tax=Fictibacillus sp. Mic-4 TaxID=3132826 RepID=UPI003CEE4457